MCILETCLSWDMDNMNDFVDNANLGPNNSLTHLLDIEHNEQLNVITHSPYHSTDELIQSITLPQTQFSYLSLNCYSLSARIDDVKLLIEKFTSNSCPLEAIALQETWLTDETVLSHYNIPGYNLISVGHHASARGGLAIYIRDHWNYTIKCSNRDSVLWEYVFVEIYDPNTKNNNSIILGDVYRPPRTNSADLDTFMEEFNVILRETHFNNKNTYIAGDFNLNLLTINEVPFNSEYFDNILAGGFIPMITLPTRLSTNSTLIDNIFTNNMNDIKSYILSDYFSDHQAIIVLASEKCPRISARYVTIRKTDEQSKLRFKQNLNSKDILTLLDKQLNSDPNHNYEILEQTIRKTMNESLPTKVVKFNKKKHKITPWITYGIIRSINQRNKLYKKMKKTNVTHVNYTTRRNTFNDYRNTLRKTIANAKKLYYSNLFNQYKNNLRKIWSIISDTLNKKKHQLIPEYMIINGIQCFDQQQIVDQFNNYFVSIVKLNEQDMNIQGGTSYMDYLLNNVQTNFIFHTINEEVTKCMIQDMKSSHSSGHDGITTELLKLINDDICKSITLIINQSLTTGIFPDKMKIAKVTPIYKKGNKHDISNYRPISVLPIISKLFETTIFVQLTAYFTHNGLLSPQQYGYKKNSSTELAALELIDRVIEQLNKHETPINLYLDLSKAFDSIDHAILLSKLRRYGVNNLSLRLIDSYLKNRYQYVQINENCSDMLPIVSGVPQGSILGPLLFNIFIIDITHTTDRFNFIMYADDTTLNATLESFDSDLNVVNLHQKITIEINKIVKWLDINKLCLNVSKSKFMLFHMPPKVIPQLNFTIKQCNIEYVDTFNFLGITFDCHLTWKQHINLLSIKISRVIGILHKLKYIFPRTILQNLYSSLIIPHLNYGLLAWGTKCEKVSLLQKRAIRTIYCTSRTGHTEPLLKKMNQIKLADIYTTKLLKLYYKLYRNQLPIYFEHFLPQYGNSRYPIRYTGLHLPSATRYFCELNSKYQLHILLREISHPHNIVRPYPYNNDDLQLETLILTLSPQAYSRKIKTTFLESYKERCTIINCINNCN